MKKYGNNAVYVVRESNEEVDKNEGSKLEECTCDVGIALIAHFV